jgi:hypothetical protein
VREREREGGREGGRKGGRDAGRQKHMRECVFPRRIKSLVHRER